MISASVKRNLYGWVLKDSAGNLLAVLESVKREGLSEPAFILDVEAYARMECRKCPTGWGFRVDYQYLGNLVRAVIVYAKKPDEVHFAGL